jgi:hypothetical protein
MARLLLVGALVALASMAMAAPALGGKPTVIHDRFTDEFSEQDFCGAGFTVEHSVSGVQNIREDGESFKATGRVRDVITNPDNGRSVIVSSAGQVTNEIVSGDPEGVHTHLLTFKGLPEKIQTAHGEVLTRDAGVIAIADTFDGDVFISSEVVLNKGPHPEADSDFELFCEVVVDALS